MDNIKKQKILCFIRENLKYGDVKGVSRMHLGADGRRYSVSTVRKVLYGLRENDVVFTALYDKARKNAKIQDGKEERMLDFVERNE